jgi:DNA-binding MarR family transcriptional regulator
MSRAPASPPPGPDHLLLVLRELGEAAGLFEQVFADRIGLARTDLVVLSLLAARGPQTAGQLAEATGLTSGALTGVIDRLERAGYARRTPDASDRRRVIVTLLLERLAPLQQLNEPLHQAVHALDAEFTQAQRVAISDYVRRAAGHFRAEALRLRGDGRAPPAEQASLAGDLAWAPLAGVRRGRLEFSAGAARLELDAAAPAGRLFQASFEGRPPRLAVRGGTITVAYPRFGPFGGRKGGATLSLSAGVPWEVEVRGGLARLDADLTGLALARLEVRGGCHGVRARLPAPRGTVTVRLTGGASEVALRRPAGAEARLRVTGGATSLAFDAQRLGAVGGTVQLETPGYATAEDRYDFELTGGAAGLSVTAG